MKNFFKLLGIISLALVIGFGVAACSSGGGGGGGGKIDSALHGTWVGDEDNGTLIIDQDKFSVPEGQSGKKANTVQGQMAMALLQVVGGATLTVKNGHINMELSNGYDYDIYTYSVSGNTLTITDAESSAGTVAFTGSKQ